MIENIILSHLINNEEFSRKVIPHIKAEYFEENNEQIICKLILNHFRKYNKRPNEKVLLSELEGKALPDKLFEKTYNSIKSMTYEEQDIEWLFNKTEEYCKEQALRNALLLAVEKSETDEKGQIPSILEEALGINFDTNLGHDYFDNASERFDFYQKKEDRLPFDLEILNIITQGGSYKKTFNMLMGGCVHPTTKIKVRYRKKT